MQKFLSIALLSAGFVSIPMLGGCDDKASTSKEVKRTNSDGTTTVDKQKSTTDANGDTKTTTEHKTNTP